MPKLQYNNKINQLEHNNDNDLIKVNSDIELVINNLNKPVSTNLENNYIQLNSPKNLAKPPHGPQVPGSEPVQPVVIQNSEVDVKLNLLNDFINKSFVPINLKDAKPISEASVDTLSEQSYLYVDNNGKPVKLLALATLTREIRWEDLAESTQQQIQSLINQSAAEHTLVPGENITIDEHNVISADIGVKSINGQDGQVTITAEDLNAYTKDVVYTKDEACSQAEFLDAMENLIVDGGRYE